MADGQGDVMSKVNEVAINVAKMAQAFEALTTKVNDLEKEKFTAQDCEKVARRVNDQDAYYDPPNLDQNLIDTLPEKFSIAELPKFKATDNPRYFLRGFKLYMDMKKINLKLYPRIFPNLFAKNGSFPFLTRTLQHGKR